MMTEGEIEIEIEREREREIGTWHKNISYNLQVLFDFPVE